MKKTIVILSAALALVACNKENPAKEKDNAIDVSKVVFNVTIDKEDPFADTKGVKTGWEDNDFVYLLFEDNEDQVVMEYDDGAWTYSYVPDDLDLKEGGKLTAVYFSGAESLMNYDDENNAFILSGLFRAGFFLTAESVDYSVETVDDITTVSANIVLTAPEGLVQFYIPKSEVDPESYLNLNVTHVSPIDYENCYFRPGGDAIIATGTPGFLITNYTANFDNCYASYGGDEGFYFYGILEESARGKEQDYWIQLLYNDDLTIFPPNHSRQKTVENKTINSGSAIKITNMTDMGRFVSLDNNSSSLLWATGNLKDDGTIAGPYEAGDYYKWGYTTVYDVTGTSDAYLAKKNDEEFDDIAAVKNPLWSMPTKDQFAALINNSTFDGGYDYDYGLFGCEVFISSNVNGVTLSFYGASWYVDGNLLTPYEQGFYWSSTPDTSDNNLAYFFCFDDSSISTARTFRRGGCFIRPVQN